jgi:peptidoglycan-associated lipoprotein
MTVKSLKVVGLLLMLAACSGTSEEATLGTSGAAGVDGLGTETSTGSDAFGTSDVSGSELANQAEPGTQQDLEVNVGDRVFFGYDSTTLDDTARTTLDRQATWLQQFPGVSVTIEGHTDERGTREYNLALGERRAAAVSNYLSTLGVNGGRVRSISYGEERPVDPAADESAYALNRRAVTVVNVTQ